MSVIRCQVCGGKLILQNNHLAVCENCDSLQSLPRIDGTVQSTYERANHNRCNKEFDRAIDQFNKVLDAYPKDAATYWQIVLCRFGVNYEKDPRTGDYKPTVHRMMRTSLMANEDYLKALEYATPEEKEIYEEKAAEIYQIQQRYERISQREKAFDVFISYKDTEDDTGERTRDSEIAHRIYNDLTAKGLRVFFSHITLREKSGEDYEPYIFAALESAPVMLLVTTSAQHVNGVWVRNEWMRYLALTATNSDKVLIPVIQDMDPYDLPTEIGHLQAVNLQAVGALPQLIARVQELTRRGRPAAAPAAAAAAMPVANDVRPLVDGMFRHIADGFEAPARNNINKIVAQVPNHPAAYLGKLLLDCKVRKEEELVNVSTPLNAYPNFNKALTYADEAMSNRLMALLDTQRENIYQDCVRRVTELRPQWKAGVSLDAKAHQELSTRLAQLEDYKDSPQLLEEVDKSMHKAFLAQVQNLEKERKYEEALALLEDHPRDRDVDLAIERIQEKIRKRNDASLRAVTYRIRCSVISWAVHLLGMGLMVWDIVDLVTNYDTGITIRQVIQGHMPVQLSIMWVLAAGLIHGLSVENERYGTGFINGVGQLGLPALAGIRMLLCNWNVSAGIFSGGLIDGLVFGAMVFGLHFLFYNLVGTITARIRHEDYEWNRLIS